MSVNSLKFWKNERGDTIIEVLIVIAVISMVIGGAFVSANQSLNSTRSSQERIEATKLVESQIERLRIAANSTSSSIFTTTDFCLTDAQAVVPKTDAQCRRQPISGGVTYAVSITRPTNGNNITFTAQVTWERLGGGSTESVKMVYRTGSTTPGGPGGGGYDTSVLVEPMSNLSNICHESIPPASRCKIKQRSNLSIDVLVQSVAPDTVCTKSGYWGGGPISLTPQGSSGRYSENRTTDTATLGSRTYTVSCSGASQQSSPQVHSTQIEVIP